MALSLESILTVAGPAPKRIANPDGAIVYVVSLNVSVVNSFELWKGRGKSNELIKCS